MFAWVAAAAFAGSPQDAVCRASQIMLRRDGKDRDFNGMSHSGTLIVLRNRGRACQIEALPHVGFTDARGRALPIMPNAKRGRRPGRAMLPVTIPAGGTVATPLRWVSGNVFDRSRCFSPTRLRLTIGRKTISVRFSGRICGPADRSTGFDQPPLSAEAVD
ncbi:hypothetical protein FHS31_002203 [Sphingomonas vulcanisoli]|uniref:DUF4232 domain-containing protein n=1 Tax=Sphingomonas vulcanisoli TaxID=1658060 RepID=A0ABX0TSX6_9SPHN|nr:DUF4232 domain-containing protein [Sphingomonas vulcanisoli]NIJ08582.1 hypothetical protein [Sphingomonas vulcanisoli]